jgi:ferredoxin--NADP+ reductase
VIANHDSNEWTEYDLVIVGGNAGGLSVAVSSLRSGLSSVRLLESGHSVAFPELVGPDEIDVGYGEWPQEIDINAAKVIVTTNKHRYLTRACLIAERRLLPHWKPSVEMTLGDRIRVDALPEHIENTDVLVVGYTDHAVEITAQAAAAGARVVLAAGGMEPERLSPAGDHMLRRLERERRATLLYKSTPHQIGMSYGYPMVDFGDRRTPALQFDHVVFASHRETLLPDDVGLTEAGAESGRVWFLGEPDETTLATTAPGWRIGSAIAVSCFPELQTQESKRVEQTKTDLGLIEHLRSTHYNATITHFQPAHSDLWVLRVRPDHGGSAFQPGQYASLGLGYWEERADEVEEDDIASRWDKLVRRSYSISSRLFDENGYLADVGHTDELEFYIVHVPPSDGKIPGLTPRLALKRPGDRIYLGPKVAGRYTLDPVADPSATVVFLATGTGEAPHNAMVVELLRKGHYGPIVSVVSVRRWADLGYLEQHYALAGRYSNYHYLPLPTREPEIPKRYIQDLLRDGTLEEMGIDLNPRTTHVFLCGNPAMIGLPSRQAPESFPEPVGVVELLTDLGFALDRHPRSGNIHVEEYW